MSKIKGYRFRKMSSAALIGLAVYGASITPAFASEMRARGRHESVRTERVERIKKTNSEVIGEGTIKSMDKGLLVVTRKKDGKDFSVRVGGKTKIFKGFGKKMDFGLLAVGHRVMVKGETSLGDGEVIEAKVIRDFSLKSIPRTE